MILHSNHSHAGSTYLERDEVGQYDCILCGRNLGKSAEADLRGARVDYCSMYDHDMEDGSVKDIDHGCSPFELVKRHERWLRDKQRVINGRGCEPLTSFGIDADSSPSSSFYYVGADGGIRLLAGATAP